jgi:hypothetical protein
VVSHVDSSGNDPILRANGGDSADSDSPLDPEPIGVLMVSAPPGASGEVVVTGNLYVTTLLAAQPVAGLPLGLVGLDLDVDGVLDSVDNCPGVANPGQQASIQDGLVGFGCACLCGDVNNSCTVSAADVQDIQRQILPQLGSQPGCYQIGSPDDQGICNVSGLGREVRGCDANSSSTCSSTDAQTIQNSFAQLFGSPSFPLSSGYSPSNCAQSTPDPIP